MQKPGSAAKNYNVFVNLKHVLQKMVILQLLPFNFLLKMYKSFFVDSY